MLTALRQIDPGIRSLIVVDTEFITRAGELPEPVCLVACELPSNKIYRLFFSAPGEGPYPPCPFSLGADTVFIAHNSTAEFSVFLTLGWELPARVLDLYVEHLHFHNEEITRERMKLEKKNSLLEACRLWGIPVMATAEKAAMRDLILRGRPYSDEKREAILHYCQMDVEETSDLLKAMTPSIKSDNPAFLKAALLRGRYMKAVAKMEANGIPMDAPLVARLQAHWVQIKAQLISKVDEQYHIFDGGTMKDELLEAYLESEGILDGYPRTPTGRPSTSEKEISRAADRYPQLKSLAALKATLSQTRLGIEFPISTRDARCRTSLFPFGSITGRNQPSNKRYVFGSSSWMRHLVRPGPGQALQYCDWKCQEFAVAAHLSQDPRMLETLKASDPYLAFAILAGAAPPGATKASHPLVRERFKSVALGVLYGKTSFGLGRDLRISEEAAQALLDKHRMLFSRFWAWQEKLLDTAIEDGRMVTGLGTWVRQIRPRRQYGNGHRKDQLKSLMNFPMQSTGSELMRLVACYATESGLRLAASVHDGFLVEAPEADIARAGMQMVECMNWAARTILGTEIAVETKPPIFHSGRFIPDKSEAVAMWKMVMGLLEDLEQRPQPSGEFRLTPGPEVATL